MSNMLKSDQNDTSYSWVYFDLKSSTKKKPKLEKILQECQKVTSYKGILLDEDIKKELIKCMESYGYTFLIQVENY